MLRLVQEPFRLFFVAGLLASIVGVSLWPLYYWQVIPFHPGVAHSRLMIHGFIGAFLAGFLSTAGPRLMAAPALRPFELLFILLLWGGGVVTSAMGRIEVADYCFLAFVTSLLVMLLSRFCCRGDIPPPCMISIPVGLLSGIFGLLLLIGERHTTQLSMARYLLGRELAFEAFILLPILGTSPYLLPRFLNLPCRHDFPPSRVPPPGWWPRALAALACALLLLAGWYLKAIGFALLAPLLLSTVAGIYLLREIPLLRRTPGNGTLALNLRIAALCLPLGLFIGCLAPAYRVPLNHWLFIAGAGFLVLSIGARVILGHGERHELITRRRSPLWISILTLVLIGAATRMIAEPIPKIMISHHIYAALSWIIAAVLWGVAVVPVTLNRAR